MEIVNRNGKTYFVPATDAGNDSGGSLTFLDGNRHSGFSQMCTPDNFLDEHMN